MPKDETPAPRKRAARKPRAPRTSPPPELHAVGPDDAAPPAKDTSSESVSQALASGDELRILEATQRVLSRQIDNPTTSARDLSALIRRLHDNHKLIGALKAERGDQEDGVGDALNTADEAFDGTV